MNTAMMVWVAVITVAMLAMLVFARQALRRVDADRRRVEEEREQSRRQATADAARKRSEAFVAHRKEVEARRKPPPQSGRARNVAARQAGRRSPVQPDHTPTYLWGMMHAEGSTYRSDSSCDPPASGGYDGGGSSYGGGDSGGYSGGGDCGGGFSG